MMGPVDGIADIMHVSGDLGKFNLMLRISEPFQDLPCLMRHMHTVRLGMVCKAQQAQIGVSFFQICIDFLILPDFFILHDAFFSFSLVSDHLSYRNMPSFIYHFSVWFL